MKIRYDYVTNSSSSSFLLGFKDEESIEQVLNDSFGYLAPVVAPYVMKDIVGAEKMNFEQAKKYIQKEVCYNAFYEKWFSKYGKDVPARERWNHFEAWLESPDGESELDTFFDEHWLSDFKKHPEYKLFVALEYGNEMADYDDDNDLEIQIDLESDFMFKLGDNLIADFGHH